jgi:hypothetical protein
MVNTDKRVSISTSCSGNPVQVVTLSCLVDANDR